VPGAESYIVESLDWCGIHFDEGIEQGGPYAPYRQSERRGTYEQYALKLVAEGKAYFAFDTEEALDEMRRRQEEIGTSFTGYNFESRKEMKNSLTLTEGQVQKLVDEGHPYVIRIMIPENEEITFFDEIRGEITVNTRTLDDKVLFKSDGMPTYHLANVVDDHLMKISHVIRGEEWLPSLPLHVLLYRFLGWEETMPSFAHLPLLLKPSGKGKLSKRDGDKMGFPVFPLEWRSPETGELSSGYRESGYFPEAFVNMLALLGWNPGTEQEIFSMEELIQAFDLNRVSKSGSRFDPDKARWFNHQYLMQKSNSDLTLLFLEELEKHDVQAEKGYVEKVVELIKERADFVKDFWAQSFYFFRAPETYDQEMIKKRWKENTPEILEGLLPLLENLSPFNHETIENTIKKYIEVKGLNMGQVMIPIRLCLIGSGMGPGLTQVMEMIGVGEVVRRVRSRLAPG